MKRNRLLVTTCAVLAVLTMAGFLKAADSAARTAWLKAEIEFVETLGAYGYENLALEVLDRAKKVQPPLSAEQLSSLDSASAKLIMQRVSRLEDPAEKCKVAAGALNQVRKVVSTLPKDSPLRFDAELDLLEMTYNLAGILSDDIQSRNLTDLDAAKNFRAQSNKVVSVNNRVESLKKREYSLRNQKKKDKSKEGDWKKVKDELAKAIKEKSTVEGKYPIIATALRYFEDGENRGKRMREKVDDSFYEALGKFEDSRGKEKKEALRQAESWFERKVKLQHLMEKGYGDWIPLVTSSGEKARLIARAKEYIEGTLIDYEDYWPQDKRVYINWMRVLGQDIDDTSKQPRFDPDVSEEDNDPMRYIWSSDKLSFVFNRKIIADKDTTDKQRLEAAYTYSKSLLTQADGLFAKSDKANNAKQRTELMSHGKGLLEKAQGVMKELQVSKGKLGAVDQLMQERVKVNLETDVHLIMSERYQKASKTKASLAKKAKEEIQKAYEILGQIMTDGTAAMKFVARERLDVIKAQGKRITGEDIEAVPSLFVEAENMIREAMSPGVGKAEKEKFLHDGIDLFFKVIEHAKGFENRKRRAVYLPKSWSYLGTAALMLGDYYTAYIANFEVVQEFTPGRYPRDRFAAVDVHFKRAMNNLRVAAYKQMKNTESEFDRELYVDSLLILQSTGQTSPDMVVSLINELTKLNLNKQAVEYIDQVPAGHLYYRLVMMMGAGIYQTMMKDAQKELDSLPKTSQERPELEKLAAEYRAKAESSANRFMEALKTRAKPDPKEKQQVSVYNQETEQIPAALLIPIANTMTAKEYGKVGPLIEKFVNTVKGLKTLDAKARNKYLADGYWFNMIATVKQVDEKKDPVEKIAQAYKKAGELQKELKKYDTEELYLTRSYMIMGAGWNNLANRTRSAIASVKDKAKVEAMEKQVEEYSLSAANWFRHAQIVVYKQMGIGLHIGSIYSEQEMHADAEAVYDKVIKYWAESNFTEDWLYASGKSLSALKSASPSPVASAVSGVVDVAKIKAAGSDAALAKALNEYVVGIDLDKNKDKVQAGLAAAEKVAARDKALMANVKQSKAIVKAWNVSREEKQKVNRTLLEAIFPGVLVVAPTIERLPSEEEFEQAVRKVGVAYLSEAGQKKAALVKGLIDISMVTSSSEKRLLNEYMDVLKQTGRADEVARFARGLKVLIYGVVNKKTNKIEKRNYSQAKTQIDAILAVDRKIKTPNVPTLPIKGFLEKVKGALDFNARILGAKKKYAEAMVELGKFDKALSYLEALVKFYPGNSDLLLAQAETYSAMGVKESGGENGKAYGQKAAEQFTMSRMTVLDVVNYSKPRSEVWWMARRVSFDNDIAEVLARKAAGAAGEKKYKVEVEYYNRKTEKREKASVDTIDLKVQGQKTATDIDRMLSQNPPADWTLWAKGALAKLEKVGFKPKVFKLDTGKDAGGKK